MSDHADASPPLSICPYAKSDMTPCYLKDGDIAIATTGDERKICVGCEHKIEVLRDKELKSKS